MSLSSAKKIFIWLLLIFFLVLVYIIFNTYFIAKDYIYGPPLLFIKNRYISVDIYPGGRQSATVFTNNNIEGKTPVEDIAILRNFLKKRGVRGVFFVIPNYKQTYPLDESATVLEELQKLKADGHEISQTGTYHTFGPDLARGAPEGAEFLKLSYDQQAERIKEGKELLTETGFPPAGFRAPEFEINRETFRVLETYDYLYSSNFFIPPRTWSTLLRPSLTKGVLYPYHPSGFELLEFTDHADPTHRYAKSIRLFNRVHSLQGVFVYHTFISNVTQPELLQLLDKFLTFIQNENTWCCTLSEVSQWWNAREKLRVETRKEGGLLVVNMINKSPFPLKDLGIKFLKAPYGVDEFMIKDHRDEILLRDRLAPKKRISISLGGNPEY